jgi:AcrR family transcriptional regulator
MRAASRKPPDSRRAILEAAAVEFSAHGYAGSSVDRISRRAAVNKAMIYYHFGSKLRLYRAILRDTFDSLHRRVSAIVEGPGAPEEKIRLFIEAFIQEGEARPTFPRIIAREIADRGSHLDPETVRLMARIPRGVAGIIEEGVAAGRFVTVEPLFCYFSLIGPIILYLMSEPVRTAIGRLKIVDADRLRRDAFVVHMKTLASRSLLAGEGRPARPPARPRPPARRSAAGRPGAHA